MGLVRLTLCSAIFSAREAALDPRLRHIEVGKERRLVVIDAAEARLQEPLARLVFVLVGQLHEDRNEEPIANTSWLSWSSLPVATCTG